MTKSPTRALTGPSAVSTIISESTRCALRTIDKLNTTSSGPSIPSKRSAGRVLGTNMEADVTISRTFEEDRSRTDTHKAFKHQGCYALDDNYGLGHCWHRISQLVVAVAARGRYKLEAIPSRVLGCAWHHARADLFVWGFCTDHFANRRAARHDAASTRSTTNPSGRHRDTRHDRAGLLLGARAVALEHHRAMRVAPVPVSTAARWSRSGPAQIRSTGRP